MFNSTRMLPIGNRKTRSKHKPHPIFGSTNPLRPIFQLFSPKKISKFPDQPEPEPLVQHDSIIFPGSYPPGPKLHTGVSEAGSEADQQSSTSTSTSAPTSSSRSTNERRKRRLEHTKSRIAYPTGRRTSSAKASLRSQKSKSFESLHKDVHDTLDPMSETMNEDDRIFLEQLEKMIWAHKYKTGLVECRDTAERAGARVSEQTKEHDGLLAQLIEEEKEARVKLEKQASEEKIREEERKMVQEQRRVEIERATHVVEEKVKEGEIKRERTRELIRVLNQSELDIMANAQGPQADQKHVLAELESIARARKQLEGEQVALRLQFEEISKARADLEETKRRAREEEEAAHAQAAARAAQLADMFRNYGHLQEEIARLRDEKEAAERKSDDVLFQARTATQRLKQQHAKALRETEEANARKVAEETKNFQVRLQQEAAARWKAEEQAAAAMAAAAQAEAKVSAYASAAQHQERQQQQQHWQHDQFCPQWQEPPEYEMQSPPPPPPPRVVLTDADRIVLYERKWEALKGITETICFEQVPWPVLIDIVHPDQLDIHEMRRFISHEAYRNLPGMEGKSSRDRVKQEMLRWHPDKFARILPRIEAIHREVVKETAEKVAKLFNQLMNAA